MSAPRRVDTCRHLPRCRHFFRCWHMPAHPSLQIKKSIWLVWRVSAPAGVCTYVGMCRHVSAHWDCESCFKHQGCGLWCMTHDSVFTWDDAPYTTRVEYIWPKLSCQLIISWIIHSADNSCLLLLPLLLLSCLIKLYFYTGELIGIYLFFLLFGHLSFIFFFIS